MAATHATFPRLPEPSLSLSDVGPPRSLRYNLSAFEVSLVSEETADRLKWFLRAYFVGAGLYLLARTPRSLTRDEAAVLAIATIAVVWATIYLNFFLGVDVTGLGRVLGVPRGKPSSGLAPGEELRFRLNFAAGSINLASFNGVFKLLLTNRRLLVGANLTNWFLLEIPLEQIIRAVARKRRLIFPPTLRIEQSGTSGVSTCKIALGNDKNFRELLKRLGEVGVRVEEG